MESQIRNDIFSFLIAPLFSLDEIYQIKRNNVIEELINVIKKIVYSISLNDVQKIKTLLNFTSNSSIVDKVWNFKMANHNNRNFQKFRNLFDSKINFSNKNKKESLEEFSKKICENDYVGDNEKTQRKITTKKLVNFQKRTRTRSKSKDDNNKIEANSKIVTRPKSTKNKSIILSTRDKRSCHTNMKFQKIIRSKSLTSLKSPESHHKFQSHHSVNYPMIQRTKLSQMIKNRLSLTEKKEQENLYKKKMINKIKSKLDECIKSKYEKFINNNNFLKKIRPNKKNSQPCELRSVQSSKSFTNAIVRQASINNLNTKNSFLISNTRNKENKLNFQISKKNSNHLSLKEIKSYLTENFQNNNNQIRKPSTFICPPKTVEVSLKYFERYKNLKGRNCSNKLKDTKQNPTVI